MGLSDSNGQALLIFPSGQNSKNKSSKRYRQKDQFTVRQITNTIPSATAWSSVASLERCVRAEGVFKSNQQECFD